MYAEEYNGYTLKLEHDEVAENPRQWDNLGTMVCFHKRYNLGDEGHGYDHRDYPSWEEIEAAIIRQEDPAVIMPLFMYDHSALDISTKVEPYWWHASWDSGRIGYIFASKDKVRKEFGVKRITPQLKTRVIALLVGEIETYVQYLNGDQWYYEIEDENGEHIDSCGGYYGYDNALEAAKEACPKKGE